MEQTFIYDRFGNRTFNAANTSTGMVSSLLTIDQSNNRFTTGQGAILYDNAGNLTRDFNGHSFSYDGENRQTSYDGGATVGGGANYLYDGDSRRVRKVNGGSLETTIFVYDAGGQMVAEYTTANQQPTGGTSYLTMDNLGTPRIITDASGSVKSRHDYLPFGEEIGLSGGRTAPQGYVGDNVRQKFTQKERDIETGLDYFGTRYFSSTRGRFTSVDPLLSSGIIYDPQTWNRYVYTLNNPLRYTDPTGMYVWDASLGGSASDKQLEKEGKHDIVNRRNEIRTALGNAALSMLSGKISNFQRQEIFRSLKAIGAEGDVTGVSLATGKVEKGTAETKFNDDAGFTINDDGKTITPSIKITFKAGVAVDGETVAHEGSHAADRTALINWLSENPTAGSLVDSPFNIKQYDSELRAYKTGSYVAQGLGEASFNAAGIEYWNKGWSKAEREERRKAGIEKILDKQYHLTPNSPERLVMPKK